MDYDKYEDSPQANSPGRMYFAAFGLFIGLSVTLSLWAFMMLVFAK